MSDQADMIIEQRNLLLSNMAIFYPNARSGESWFEMMLGPFPSYTRRHCLRDLAYLESKGYIETPAAGRRKPAAGTPWNERYWRLTAGGLEVAQKITEDPALEI